MTGHDFWTAVHQDEKLTWLGSGVVGTPPCNRAVVRGPTDVVWGVQLSTLHEQVWELLGGVLRAERSPEVIKHMSRIVGYYSMIRNWNKSKQAELRDRHRGNYWGGPTIGFHMPVAVTWSQLGPRDLPLTVVGAKMCLLCHEIKTALDSVGLLGKYTEVVGSDGMSAQTFGDRKDITESALAGLTLQDNTYPVVLDAQNRWVNRDTIIEGVEQWQKKRVASSPA